MNFWMNKANPHYTGQCCGATMRWCKSISESRGADPNIMSGDGFTAKMERRRLRLEKTIEYMLTTYGGIVSTNEAFDSISWSVFKEMLGQQMPKNEKKKRWLWW